MSDDHERRRFIASREILKARLRLLDQAAARAADSFARNAPGLRPSFGRYASDWTCGHDRANQARLADLRAEQRNDRGAMSAKITRQNAALRAMIIRDGRKTTRHVE